jgi:1-deoxy-D-xylulose-5-phosphate reductoisomerase
LRPALAAIEAGKDIAVASKEILVMAGEVVMEAARRKGVRVLPVDSEHSAIFQCLEGQDPQSVRRLILTCSGGPFRQTPAHELAHVTPEMALRHPTWSMGRKITVDSATLFNKALEMIEARWLFDIGVHRVEVVVHPQSIIHSYVEYVDGSVLAQLGAPSMELPILFALTWPERIPDSGVPAFDPVALGTLTFEAVRHEAFPMLGMGIAAGRAGGAAPAVYNAANEAAVALFLAGALPFGGIPRVVEGALAALATQPGDTLEALWAADAAARAHVHGQVGRGTA